VVQRIIGAKRNASARPAPTAAAPAAAPSVHYVAIDESSAGQRLDNFLIKLLKGVPKSHVHRVIRSGEVRVNQGRAGADTRLALGDKIRVPPVRTSERAAERRVGGLTHESVPPRAFNILYEDEHLIAIDKPAGVAVHGGSGISFGVIEQLRRARPDERLLELVHRLDKETSGVLLVARKRSSLIALQDQLRQRDPFVAKTYLALVSGAWPARLKVIDVPLHKYLSAEGERRVRVVGADHEAARRSISLVKVVRRFAAFTLLEVTIKTGRTHQIRVHVADAGHPIVGDSKYGDFELNKALARGLGWPGMNDTVKRYGGMFLHAARLRVLHPASGEALELAAPLPAECSSLLETLQT
jgi:23S rRNA pseudouridine955/2504/2580 synthase